ncbi:MAG: putative capsular polysaccharide synthesis family protein [Gammaproteobacteria bacterium]|nr:putative capsular polysaccharide synthesis family protein [Gammaproteobacteria bacterium]
MQLRKRGLIREAYEYFAVNIGPFIGWREPILIYQMGKVGSSSIRNSLFRCGDPRTGLVLMSHEFLPIRNRDANCLDVEPAYRENVIREIEHERDIFRQYPLKERLRRRFRERAYAERILRAYVQTDQPLRVITLVREPVANNVSMFFQQRHRYIRPALAGVDYNPDSDIAVFLERYVHTRPLTWFDAEFRPMLGVDIFATPFPRERGYATIDQGRVRVLILKAELEDEVKASAISEFLGLNDLEIVRSNVTSDKSFGVQYKKFKRQLRLPVGLLSKLYDSRFATHFYTTTERAQYRLRWGGKD